MLYYSLMDGFKQESVRRLSSGWISVTVIRDGDRATGRSGHYFDAVQKAKKAWANSHGVDLELERSREYNGRPV